MTKRRKDTDYLFLSARIRSLERNLLTAQRLEQLLQAPSAESCSQLLSDLGYDPIRDEATLQASLKKQREDVFSELERFMPEKELLDVFRIKYDYHNIKTLLKAPQDAERLLIDAGTVPAETMQKKHAENGGWDFLPADMAAAADEAQRVLAETGSARSSDCILDRAYFARLEKLAADSHIPYLQDYVRAMIDAANLRSLIRTQRLGLDAGFLREVLFPGGSVTPEGYSVSIPETKTVTTGETVEIPITISGKDYNAYSVYISYYTDVLELQNAGGAGVDANATSDALVGINYGMSHGSFLSVDRRYRRCAPV